jgi:hypothetical protein
VDPDHQLVSGSVEQIWQIEEYRDGTVVITDFGWYEYEPDTSIYSSEGDDIDSLNDLATELPVAFGEVTWRFVDGEYAPLKITRLTKEGTIDLREDEKAADIELSIIGEVVDDSTGGTTSGGTASSGTVSASSVGSNGSPGFGAPTGPDKKDDEDKKPNSKRETEVINLTELRKDVEEEVARNAGTDGGVVTAAEHAARAEAGHGSDVGFHESDLGHFPHNIHGGSDGGQLDDDAAGFAGP